MNLYLFKRKRMAVFFCIMFMQIVLVAQNQIRINLINQKITIENALKEVEKQSHLSIAYNQSQLKSKQVISLDLRGETLENSLKKILANTNFTYKIRGKYIMIIPKNTSSDKIIEGAVVDENGEPLIGVNVIIEGTGKGTVTNVDGNFSLTVAKGDVLKISYIGYVTKMLPVNERSSYRVVLNSDAKELDEVVVTALGIKREAKSLTYNVQELKPAGINKVKSANFINALAGKVAGVTINQSSTGVGGSSRVVMRGTKSLFGENNALYVLDGIPLQGLRAKQSDNFYESADVADGDGISNINPDDIESMSVLTGASAAALYGSRGANGVILITTKKGKIGKPRVNYTNNTTFSMPFVTPDFQNTYGRKEGEFRSWGDKLEKPSSYDPLDFFRTGVTTMNSVSLSGGTDVNRTHLSFGAVNSLGIVENNKYNRYNFTFNNSLDILKDRLSLDFGLLYVKQDNQNSNGQGMYYNPLVPVYLFPPSDDFDKYTVYERYNSSRNFKTQYWPYGNQGLGMQNPFWIINRNMFNTKRERYISTLSMKWNITDWLNVMGRGRMDRAYTDFERKLYASTDGLFSKSRGNYMNVDEKNKTTYLDVLANIDKPFCTDFRVIANLGASYYDEKYNSDSYEGNLIGTPNFFHPSNIPSSESAYNIAKYHTQTQSVYGKVELSYKNILFADITGRNDWFSTLVGTPKKSVFYPSAGLSVLLHELLPVNKKFMPFWKLRGSVAEVGNPPSPYLPYASVSLKNGNPTNASFSPANHLKPEMTRSFEIGTDIKLIDNKINLSATYYNSNTYNQLFKYELPPSTGYAYAFENAGKVNNWGIELNLGLNINLGKIDWNSSVVYTLNRNKIKRLLPEFVIDENTGTRVKSPTEFTVASAESYKMILKEGGSMSDLYATKLKQDLHGDIHVSNGTVFAADNSYIKVGSAAPKYNLGFRNSFAWKGLELDFLIDARVGGEVISATAALMDQFGVSKKTAQDRDNGGAVVNKGRIDAEQYYSVVASGKTGLLAHYVYSATNVRLRELSLSYNLPKAITNNLFDITLSVTGQNLFMFYNKAPFDPELTANTGTYYQGFDYFMPPSQRTLGFGVKINF